MVPSRSETVSGMNLSEHKLPEDEQRIEAVLVAMDRLVDAVDALAEKRDVGWLAPWGPRPSTDRGAVEPSRWFGRKLDRGDWQSTTDPSVVALWREFGWEVVQVVPAPPEGAVDPSDELAALRDFLRKYAAWQTTADLNRLDAEARELRARGFGNNQQRRAA